jgi:hypothetical protein
METGVADVLKLKGSMMEAYDLACVALVPDGKGGTEPEGLNELQKILASGYEPFAVTQFMRAPTNPNLLSGRAAQPILCDKIWLRLKGLVKAGPQNNTPVAPGPVSS